MTIYLVLVMTATNLFNITFDVRKAKDLTEAKEQMVACRSANNMTCESVTVVIKPTGEITAFTLKREYTLLPITLTGLALPDAREKGLDDAKGGERK